MEIGRGMKAERIRFPLAASMVTGQALRKNVERHRATRVVMRLIGAEIASLDS
jgi:hypothetical protein